jgi:hypothetical protein
MRLKARWESTDRQLAIIQEAAYDGFSGTQVERITDVVYHKTFLEIRYVLVGKAVPQTVYLAWRRPLLGKKATWLRTTL